MADNTIEIRIGAAIDSSLGSALQSASAQLDKIAQASAASADKLSAGTTAAIASTAQQGLAVQSAAANAILGIMQNSAALQKALAGQVVQTSQSTADAQAKNAQKAADAQAKAWASANREITSAEDTLVRDIFNKRQKLGTDLLDVARQLVEQEISTDLKYWTERELLSAEGVQKENSAQEMGMAQKLLLDKLGLTSTQTTQAAQNQAVMTGVSTRTAAESSGNAAGKAAQGAMASASIENDAHMAFAGTYAAVAQIPIIGPFLAPEAAAAAYAAVMAYDTVASFAVGADNIPHDMVAQIHKGEMIIPAGPAAAMRSGFSVAGGGTTNQSATTHQWNYAPQISGVPERNVMDELRSNAGEFMSFIQGLTRSGSMRFA